MKLMVFGKNGRIGHLIVEELAGVGECEVFALGRKDCDMEGWSGRISQMIKEIRPDIVINATACNGPEQCAAFPSVAWSVNVNAVAAMAAACRDIGALFVHFSTDYVFGDSVLPLDESCRPDPVNLYGHSKLAGENAIVAINPYYLIFRVSSVYGSDNNGPVNILEQIKQGRGSPEDPVQVLKQLCCPISASRVAKLSVHAIRTTWQRRTLRRSSGIYHMTPVGAVWKSDFARAAMVIHGQNENDVHIVEGTLAQPRPTSLPLDGTKFCKMFQVQPWNPYQDLADFLGPDILENAREFAEQPVIGGMQ